MFFLAKCAVCILLVFIVIQWRGDATSPAPKSVAARPAGPLRVGVGGLLDEALQSAASLLRAGGDALADAARDKCVAAPRACLSAAQRLQSGRAETANPR